MRLLLVRTRPAGIQHTLAAQVLELFQFTDGPHGEFSHPLDLAHYLFLPLIALAKPAFLRIFGFLLFRPAAMQAGVTDPKPCDLHHLVKLPTVPLRFMRAAAFWIQRLLPRLAMPKLQKR